MRILLFFFLLFPLSAKANSDPLFSEGEDLTLCHHVNVISGHLNLYFQDMEVQGPTPINLIRTYSSAGSLETNDEELVR